MAGHDYSLFLRFRGGNGTAPAAGALYALSPLTGLITTTGALVLLLLLHSRRAAGMVALLAFAPIAFAVGEPQVRVAGAILLVLVTMLKIWMAEGFSLSRPAAREPDADGAKPVSSAGGEPGFRGRLRDVPDRHGGAVGRGAARARRPAHRALRAPRARRRRLRAAHRPHRR